MLGRFRAELEDRLRWERVSLGKEHSEAVRGNREQGGRSLPLRTWKDRRNGRGRQRGRTGSYWRSGTVVLTNGTGSTRLKYSMLEERLEQVRELDGELAYEKMRRAVEKASQEKASQEKARQEKARQVERARLEWDRQETARQSRERRGPERGGPERDFGPSR